jgi:hypothetical protein
MKKCITSGLASVLFLITAASINAQDALNPWHLIAYENKIEVAFYNTEVITEIEATEQSVTIVLDNGKEFSHPLATTSFGFDFRKEGTATVNESINSPQWNVHYANSRLHFSKTVTDIAVFTINGTLVAQFAGSHTEVPVSLTPGIFIVQANGNTAKLFITNSHGGTIAQREIETKSSVDIPAPIHVRADNGISVFWNIITNNSTISVEIPHVEKFYFMDDKSIVFTMKDGETVDIIDYQGGEFSIESVQSDLDFCSFLSTAHLNKTIPVINGFLARLPSDSGEQSLTDEQKLLALTEWLKSCPAVIDATILQISGNNTDPAHRKINISINENEKTDVFILDILMSNPLKAIRFHEIDGIYVGTYTWTNLTRDWSSSSTPTIELKNGKYTYYGLSNDNYFNSGSGNFTVKSNKIIFELTYYDIPMEDIGVVDDWLVKGEYEYEFDGNNLIFSKTSMVHTEKYKYVFELEKDVSR